MTIYRCEVSFSMVVDAPDEATARALVRSHAEDELRNGVYTTTPLSPITDEADVPSEWRNSIPWYDGKGDDRTVTERLP